MPTNPLKNNYLHFLTRLYALLILIGVMGIFSCNTEIKTQRTTNGLTIKGNVPDKIDFSFHVKPILSDRCFKCHGPDKNAIEGGLSLHTAEDAFMALGKNKDHYAIVPGDTKNSELITRIFSSRIRSPPR